MIEWFYGLLGSLGYHHPVHPIFVHFTVGLTVASLVFGLIAWIGKKPHLFTTARHTINFAIVGYIFTVLTGFADWIYIYASNWTHPLSTKIILAGVLLPILAIAYYFNRMDGKADKSKRIILIVLYALAAVDVIVLAYFGAELVPYVFR